jgi:hypothetical protein
VSSDDRHLPRAVALDFAVELDRYVNEVTRAFWNPEDMVLRRALRVRLEELGEKAKMLPALWALWGAVVLLHFKLMHPKWVEVTDSAERLLVLKEHQAAADALRTACVRWAADASPGEPGS